MFMGEFSHTIDPKGRLIVPAKLKAELGSSFVVTKGLDGCLFAYPDQEWKNIESHFREIPLTTKDARKFTRFFFAGASRVDCDSQGRVLIPPTLREFAGLKKDVVLAGVMDRVEIWDKARWDDADSYEESDMDKIAEHMAEMGLGI